MDAKLLEKLFFAGLLALAVFLSWLVISPYVGTLVLAGTLAIIFRPVYQGLLRGVRSEILAALITVLMAVVIVFIPLVFFGGRLIGETTGLYSALTSNGGTDLSPMITHYLHVAFPNLQIPVPHVNLGVLAQQSLSWFIGNLGQVSSSIAQASFLGFLSLLGLFYFLKDGDRLKQWLLDYIPLSKEYTERIGHETELALGSVVKGTLVVSVIQGIIVGTGFFFFGITNAVFWGAFTVIASLIPLVGTWLIVIPAIAYLAFTGHMAMAAGFAIWSVILVNLVYNILSPQLMHRGFDVHPFIILLGVIGGISFFGPIGFLIGPFIVALLFSLLRIYPKLILKK